MSILRSSKLRGLPKGTSKSKLRRAARARRGGSVVVVVAMSMVMLMGFAAIAVDYGVLVTDANQLQRGCDAAAVAGASELYKNGTSAAALTTDQTNARNIAVAIAAKNGVEVSPNNVSFPTNNKIKVVANRNRKLFFAAAMGIPTGKVSRSATAGRIALKGVSHAVPLAMTTDDYYANIDGRSFEYQLINNHDTDFLSTTVASLDLRPDNSGKSGAVFQTDLTNGYDGTIYIGQKIDNSLNSDIGSQGSKLDQAMDDRIARAALAPYNDTGSNYTYPNYPAGDPRIMLLIVAPPNPYSNNNPTLNALFFVPVYLESTRSPAGKNEYLRMRILPIVTYSSQDPTIALDTDTATITGPSVVSLLS